MGLAILAEALARIEHKVDHLIRHLNVPVYPMHFSGNACPVCSKAIDYQVDVKSQIVTRRCDCTTGKVPSAIPLLPVAPPTGAPNGYSTVDAEQRPSGAEESPRRKAR